MGIYIFSWEVLKSYLIKDAEQKTSSHDFGKDIIPAMLHDNRNYMFIGLKVIGRMSGRLIAIGKRIWIISKMKAS